MKRLLFETSIPKIYIMVMIGISIFMLGGYFSYAMFTVQKEKKNAISIVTGNLTAKMTIDGTNSNTITASSNTSKEATVVLTNTSNHKVRINFYYTGSLAANTEVFYIASEGFNTPPLGTGVVLEKSGSAGSSVTYKIRFTNNTTTSQSISFAYQVGLDNIDLSLPNNAQLVPEKVMPLLTSTLLAKYSNDASITDYESKYASKEKMYVFNHTAGAQQTGYTAEELTDYRYIGDMPNNYITFNNEMWRIVGIFTVEDETGKKEQRVKIVRDQSIGSYSWDNSVVENSYGKNRWSDAKLQYMLNNEEIGYYWNRKQGSCPSGGNNATVACDFSTTGLTSSAKNMIAKTKWYLGGIKSPYNTAIVATTVYNLERGTTVYDGGRNGYPREISWTGYVGLMYPSDFVYTYAYGIDSRCFDTNIYTCVNTTSWVYAGGNNQWLLSPSSDISSNAFFLSNYAFTDGNERSFAGVNEVKGIKPSVYLKASVKYISGTGASNDPFIIDN